MWRVAIAGCSAMPAQSRGQAVVGRATPPAATLTAGTATPAPHPLHQLTHCSQSRVSQVKGSHRRRCTAAALLGATSGRLGPRCGMRSGVRSVGGRAYAPAMRVCSHDTVMSSERVTAGRRVLVEVLHPRIGAVGAFCTGKAEDAAVAVAVQALGTRVGIDA